jgi:large conductance mechanosensitive channel
VLKGFKDFLLRGNVVELAVAVVIGVAFNALVTAFTDNIVNPIIAAMGGANIHGLAFQLVPGNPESVLNFGKVLSAGINFLLIATVVYFMFVLPFKIIEERRKRGEEPGPAEPTEVEVLKEIRDLLDSRQARPSAEPARQSVAPGRQQQRPSD